MKLLTSIAIIMQSENCSEQVLNEPSTSQTQPATRAHMEQTVNNIEIFNYVINIFVLIENKCNNIEKVGGGSKGMRAVDGKL